MKKAITKSSLRKFWKSAFNSSVAVAAVLSMSCGLQAAPGGKGGGGGGGDKGATGKGPVCLLFCDSLDPAHLSGVDQTLLSGLSNPLRMTSDLFLGGVANANDYCDGREENIFAEILEAGGTPPYLKFDSQDNEHAGLPRRTLFLDFNACDPDLTVAAGSVCTLPDWFEGATTTEELEAAGWETSVDLKVGNQAGNPDTGSLSFDILGMAEGETREDVRLTMNLTVQRNGVEELVFIFFHERPYGPSTDLPDGYTPPGDYINVTRLSATEWLVVVPDDRVASVKANHDVYPTNWLGYYRFPGAFLIYK